MDDRPLCLLALDGGGIRGLSELVVLEEIMNRIKYDLDLDGDLLPADFFDLIGGTSTGGLIALLLGRLRRSVPQARREYLRIAEEVFSLPRYLQKNTFDGRKLEEAVRRLLGNDRSEEKMLERDGSCKVFVCAVPQQDVKGRAGPRLFRTYRVSENASFNCTIWEACRATSVAPSCFEPIKIGDDGEQETFVDGGLGYNNPVEQVLEEARRIFPGRKVACVVSVGTGVASAIAFPDSPKTSPVKLINALKNMATESDTTAEKMHRRFQNTKDTYFRFSVDRGLQGIGLEEWKELANVRAFTTEYLHQRVISEQVNEVVIALLASKIIGQEGSHRLVQLSVGSSDAGGSEGLPRTLEWRPKEGSTPSFRYTTEQLASHIVVPLSRRHFLVPFGRNKDFVGRHSILMQLLERIPPSADKDDCQRTAITGLGGVGKTQIALEAAFRVRDEHPNCHVFWVPAVDATTFEYAYREIGRRLEIPGIDDDKADVRTLVKTALSKSADNWLLIVDNADDVEQLFGTAGATPLCDCLPFTHRGSILFTTRNHGAIRKLDIPETGVIRVADMSRLEATELLQKQLDAAQMSDSESTTELLDFLAGLPLAIKQASAYINQTKMTTRQYLRHCRSSDERLIELLGEDFKDRARYKSTRNPVAATWLISFRHISRDDQLAAQYLRYMSLLAEKEIPKSLLPPGKSELEADNAIGTLKAYGFITKRAGQESYDIHRLVRVAMRSWLSKEGELEACVASLIQQLDKAFPFPEHENRAVWVTYLPHALTTLAFCDYSTHDVAKSSLLFKVAQSSYILGKYKEAEAMHWQALKLQTEVLGAEHPATLTSMNNLAHVLDSQGKYKEAEAIQRQALKLQTKVLRAEHPSTLTSMNNLALVLRSQGKYGEAEAMYRQALELRTQVLDAEHPATLTSMGTAKRGHANEGEDDLPDPSSDPDETFQVDSTSSVLTPMFDTASTFQASTSETALTSQAALRVSHFNVGDQEKPQPSDPSDLKSVISNFEQPLNPAAKESVIRLMCWSIQRALQDFGGFVGTAGFHPGAQVQMAAKLRTFVKSMAAKVPKTDQPDRDGLKVIYLLRSDIARRLEELLRPEPEYRFPLNHGDSEPIDLGQEKVKEYLSQKGDEPDPWTEYQPADDEGPPAPLEPADGSDGSENGELGDIFVNGINAREVIDHLTADPAFKILVSEISDVLEQYAIDKLAVIRSRISESFASQPSHDSPKSRPFCARFQADWDLEGYLRANYDGVSQNLSTIIATVGVLPEAQLCTVGEYFKQVWETHETELLRALQEAIHERKANGHEQRDINTPTVTEPLADGTILVDLDSNTIAVYGSEEFIVVIAQQLAWLLALTHDNGDLEETKYAYVRVKELQESEAAPNLGPLFDVSVNLERPPKEDEGSDCWTAILGRSVLITGYPTKERPRSMLGLEASPQIMASLASIPVAVTFRGGFVFKGRYHALVPTRRLDTSVQWHVIALRPNQRELEWRDITDRCPGRLRHDADNNALWNSRSFFGWCDSVVCDLGTKTHDFNSKTFDPSGLKPLTGFSHVQVTKITGTVGYSNGAKAEFATEFTFARHKGVPSSELDDYHDTLRKLESIPVIIHGIKDGRAIQTDGEEASLHMLFHRRQVWETSHSKLGDRDVLSPARPGKPDGVRAAMQDNEGRVYRTANRNKTPGAEKVYFETGTMPSSIKTLASLLK